jgi:quinol monooxygenase YgiN
MKEGLCIEMVKIKPKEGAAERMMELRQSLVDYYSQYDGFVSLTLIAAEDGKTWYDIGAWESKAHAEKALADKTPEFEEWSELAPLDSFEWAEVISYRG